MAVNPATLAAVRRLLKDTGTTKLLADNEISEAIDGAIERYSKDRPREYYATITGDGGKYYRISTNLANWQRGFSSILYIDYDTSSRISGDEEEYPLEPIDWKIYLSATDTEYLELIGYAPSSSEDFLVAYTGLHTHDSVTDTINAADLQALRHLAVAYCCDILANKAAQSSDTTIPADAVSYSSKQRQFLEMSRRWAEHYFRHMGLSAEGDPEAAAGIADWDRSMQRGGRRGDYLFHQRRSR